MQITEQTFYRWRKQFGGMGIDQLKELKRLQKENDPYNAALVRFMFETAARID